MGAWGIGHWIIVLIIVLLVFGTKRLTSGAKDVGKAVNEFKKGMREEDEKPAQLSDQSKRESSGETQRDDDNVAR
jgi:sec-independent protein translocase protein TatA